MDTINLNGQFDFDSNHKDDLKGYLPHGSEAGDASTTLGTGGPDCPGPWANRVIAYLWEHINPTTLCCVV